jgi:hypothetical protein
MGKITTYRCDAPNCDQMKNKMNSWFVFTIDKTRNQLACMPLDGNEDLFAQTPPVGMVIGVLCSHECAQKVFESFLYSITQQPNPVSTKPQQAERVYPDGLG